MIPRRLVQIGLSPEAVGLLVIVACQPPSALLSAGWIEAATGWGRDKRQKVMRELVGAGLLDVRAEQAADGRWSKLYVFDWNVLLSGRVTGPKPEKPVSVPKPENPVSDRDRKIRSSRRPENPVIDEEDKTPAVAAAAIRGEAAATAGGASGQGAKRFDLDRARVSASIGHVWMDPAGIWRKAADFALFEASQEAENKGGQHG